jgi:hypothetical protein
LRTDDTPYFLSVATSCRSPTRTFGAPIGECQRNIGFCARMAAKLPCELHNGNSRRRGHAIAIRGNSLKSKPQLCSYFYKFSFRIFFSLSMFSFCKFHSIEETGAGLPSKGDWQDNRGINKD